MSRTQSPPARSGPWYLLFGLLIGLSLGILYSWGISPVKYTDTEPSALRSDFKDQYRAGIASAYLATGDLGRAQSRLALLQDADPVQALTTQASTLMAGGDLSNSAFALTSLADALQQAPAIASIQPSAGPSNPPATEASPTLKGTATSGPKPSPTFTKKPTHTPITVASPTARPTRTATRTPGSPFTLSDQESLCDSPFPGGTLQVVVQDASGKQVPGMEIIIRWEGNEEHFFTGLKPELGNGYADYLMTPDVLYTIQLGTVGTLVGNITPPLCITADDEESWGVLWLLFSQ